MEILNNFWNMLFMENEELTQILILPFYFVESILAFSLFTIIFKINYTKQQKFKYIFFLSAEGIITQYFIPTPFNVVINYAFTFILVYILFKPNLIKNIIIVILPPIVYALTGILILKPFLAISNLSQEKLQLVPVYRFIYLITTYFIVSLILLFIKFFNFHLQISDEFSTKNKKIIIMNFIFAIITLCIQLIITVFYTKLLPIGIIFLNFITLFAYFFISFYSLTRVMKLQITTKNLENAENYNATLVFLYDNVKGFKHDFDNMVYMIGGFIKTNDMEGLKKYYYDLEKECINLNNIAGLNPQTINNSGIYNLLMAKYKKANEKNVNINLEFFLDLDNLQMKIYEFSRILGILLDNAIESASECEVKQINIMFRESHKNHVQIVSIENTYIDKNMDSSKIFEKGVSGKKNHTGMGLWEVREILMRNNNVNLYTSKDDEYFKQQLEIFY